MIHFSGSGILPHILPHIKIRVTEGVSLSALDLIEGVGPQEWSGLRLGSAVYLIGWRRGWRMILFSPDVFNLD